MIGRISRLRFGGGGGLIFGRAFWGGGDGGLLSEFYGIHLCCGKLKLTAGFINNCYISTLKLLTSVFDFIWPGWKRITAGKF